MTQTQPDWRMISLPDGRMMLMNMATNEVVPVPVAPVGVAPLPTAPLPPSSSTSMEAAPPPLPPAPGAAVADTPTTPVGVVPSQAALPPTVARSSVDLLAIANGGSKESESDEDGEEDDDAEEEDTSVILKNGVQRAPLTPRSAN